MVFNSSFIVSEKIRAKCAVDEFLDTNPSLIEIQTYIQMARNDLKANPQDLYSKEIITILSGNED